MRIVFVGASRLTLHTARLLLEDKHDVVVIETDAECVRTIASELSCGVIQGDGSTPAILREADPTASDFLFCLTNNDQTNIIASLVGRSLGFKQVVTRIDTPEFEHICLELGLENTIIPSRAIARQLRAMVRGELPPAISTHIKNDAALFSFVAGKDDAVAVAELNLPDDCRLIIVYRSDKFILANDKTELKKGDEAVILCHSKHLDELSKRWIHINNQHGADEQA